MNRYSSIFVLFLVAGTMNCGGSASTSTSSDSGGETDAETAAVQDLTNLPSLDLSSYDLTSTASDSGLVKAMRADPYGEGDDSIAGCEANRHKNEMTRMTKELEGNQCMVKKTSELGIITVPVGSFNYYAMNPDRPHEHDGEGEREAGGGEGGGESGGSGGRHEGEGGGGGSGGPHAMEDSSGEDHPPIGDMKMRLGVFCIDDSGNEIDFTGNDCAGTLRYKMDMCHDDSLTMEMRYAVVDGHYNGTVVHSFRGGHKGHLERSKISADVNTNPSGDFDFTSASIRGNFDGQIGRGAMSFNADAQTLVNTIQASFDSLITDPSGNSLTHNGDLASEWSGTDGCGHFHGTGEFPAMICSYEDWVPLAFQGEPCCVLPPENPGDSIGFAEPNGNGNCQYDHEATEPYAIELDGDGNPVSWIITDASDFCAPTEALTELEAEEISFVDNWDCSAPAGQEFLHPDFSVVAAETGKQIFEDCFGEMNKAREEGEYSTCMQKFGEKHRDDTRKEFSGEEENEPIVMILDSQDSCDTNPMPDRINVLIDEGASFGVESDMNNDDIPDSIGGGLLDAGALQPLEHGFDPNQGETSDAHRGCTGTVTAEGISVSHCEDGCSFVYSAE